MTVRNARGMTMVEVFVVMVIISILCSVPFPGLDRRSEARGWTGRQDWWP